MKNITELQASFLNGRTLLVDKPLQWTSFDVVNKIKSLLRYRLDIKKIRIGHAGTLDPLATGLLIICTGKATKQIEQYQSLDKRYTGTFYLGKTTPSFDLETDPENQKPLTHITPELLHATAREFTGPQQQIPPLYSAKKIEGDRAYKHARQGLQTKLKPNHIHIKSFEVTQIILPEVGFSVTCSKGTYIRALARDFGQHLGTGAHLSTLRRTHIGTFSVTDALLVTQLDAALGNLPQADDTNGTGGEEPGAEHL